MTKSTKRIIALGLLASLALSLSACSTTKTIKPTHKAATSACLISSKTSAPGSPDRQLAADLVEAQVIYGIKVREVQMPAGANLNSRLLTELQAGCVLLVSGNTGYLDALSSFARIHSKIMVLFVGGQIAEADQPANLRWVSDNPNLAARLAGFAAAEKGHDITLLYTGQYASVSSFLTAFSQGVSASEELNGQVKVNVQKVSSKSDFKQQVSKIARPGTLVALVDSSYLKSLDDFTGLEVIGADLQLGQTIVQYDSQVFASVERKTSKYVLSAVASLLARKVSSDPKYRVSGGVNELRVTGTLSDQLQAYLNKLANITP